MIQPASAGPEISSSEKTTMSLLKTNFLVYLHQLNNNTRQFIQQIFRSNNHLGISPVTPSIAPGNKTVEKPSSGISSSPVVMNNETKALSTLSLKHLRELRAQLTHMQNQEKKELVKRYQQQVYQFTRSDLPVTFTDDQVNQVIQHYAWEFDNEIKKADEIYRFYLEYIGYLIRQKYHDDFGVPLDAKSDCEKWQPDKQHRSYLFESLTQLIWQDNHAVFASASIQDSNQFRLKKESHPTRCEVCHQADMFTPEFNLCLRCVFV